MSENFQTLFSHIQTTNIWSVDLITDVLTQLAKQPLSPIQEDLALRTMQKKAALGLASLKKEYTQLKIEHGTPPTDLGIVIAKKVLNTLFDKAGNLLKVRGMGFYHYNGTHWIPISDDELRQRIMPIVLAHKADFGKRTAVGVVSEVLTGIGDLVAAHDPADTPKNVINTTTAEIWLSKDGSYQLKPHSPVSRLFWCLPYGYDEGAVAPLYQQTMQEIFSKCAEPAQVIRHWNEFLGYVIQPDRFVTSVWFMVGTGSNGKSTALRLLLKLLGPVSHSCDIKAFNKDGFKYRALFDKLLLVDEDYKKDLVLNEAFLKKISESSQISARSPHKLDTITFTNTALPLLVGNHYPQCKDVSYGWVRRLYVFPFDKQFAKHEVDVERFNNIASSEMPGILKMALEGYKRICQRGNKFDVPADCKQAAEKFHEQSNLMVRYIKERFQVDPKAHISLKSIRQDMFMWAQAQGLMVQIPNHGLKGELESLGFTVGPMDGNNSVKGYALNDAQGCH